MTLLADIWSVLTPKQRRWALAAQLLSFAMAFSTVTGIAAIAPFFSVLGNPRLIDSVAPLHWLYVHLGFTNRQSFVVALGLAFLASVLLANLINVLGWLAMNRLVWWIGTDLQAALFAEYLGRPYSFHVQNHSATLFNNVVNETIRATNDTLQNVPTLVTNAVTTAMIILSVMLLNPTIAAVMIAVLAGGYVGIYLVVRNQLMRCGQIQSRAFRDQSKIVSESLNAIREIIVLRIADYFQANFERVSQTAARATAHAQLVGQSPKYIMECVAVAGLVGLALILGGGNDEAGPWLGKLTFLGFAAYRLLPILQQAFVAIVKIRASRAGFAAITPDLRLARARKRTISAPDGAWLQRPRHEIRLSAVTHAYAAQYAPALNGISLGIPARAIVGLVGANGSGKTTLVDLLAGLLVPTAGHLQVDGVIVDESNRAQWQPRIAYVPQTIFLLDASIAQNIALGSPADAIDQARVLAAAHLAQLDEFVNTLANGYNHLVGERGVRLSGGQRQRIGIARALYAEASVLILDEATNSLDGLKEQELMATLGRLRGRYTIILIAHRMHIVRMCDLIFELEAGKLSRSGTYNELLGSSDSFLHLAHAAGADAR